MKEQKTTFTEQIAEEGGYITQAAEVSDEERLYLTRRVKLPGEKSGRGAMPRPGSEMNI